MSARGLRALGTMAASALVMLEGCYGATSGKTDSETHFACMADADCRRFGPASKCAEGFCSSHTGDRRGAAPDASSGGAGGNAGGNAGAQSEPSASTSGGQASAPAKQPLDDAGQSTTNDSGRVIEDAGAGGTGSNRSGTGGSGTRASGSGGSGAGGSGAGGSGAISDDPWDQPLASPVTFGGVITLAPGFTVPLGTLRVSLVWRTAPGGTDPLCNGGSSIPQSPTVQSGEGTVTAPGRFSLTVDHSPPRGAFQEPPFATDYAEGAVVVFVDGNGNGVLDLATPVATSSDLIIGTSSPYDTSENVGSWPNSDSYRITYSSKGLSSPPVLAGYHAYRLRTDAQEVAGDSENWPVTSDVAIELGDSTRIQMLTCKTLCFITDKTFACPASYSELPSGGRDVCHPVGLDRQYYDWYHVTCDTCACRGVSCEYIRDTTTEPPPGWPCPAGDAGVP